MWIVNITILSSVLPADPTQLLSSASQTISSWNIFSGLEGKSHILLGSLGGMVVAMALDKFSLKPKRQLTIYPE